MEQKNMSLKKLLAGLLALVFIAGMQVQSIAQVTTYEYLRVPDDKIGEFIKRETTYWDKVKDKAIKDKKMTFWGLLEKVGGYDMPNSSNYLFINTYPDIDASGAVWDNAESVAGAKMDQMETNSMSTRTSSFFLQDVGWVQDAKTDPAKDFRYVVMVYHNTDYADSLIALENKYFSPFIKKAMDNNQTPQLGWGNAKLLAPMGDNIKFTSVSYDLYNTMQDALMPKWDPKTVFPTKGLQMINKLELNRRGISIFRIVKAGSAN